MKFTQEEQLGDIKAVIHQGIEPSVTFGTFKPDPADKDLSNPYTLCTLGQRETGSPEVVERVPSLSIYDSELPRTRAQSCYMGMTPEVEHGDPLNALSPQPESPNPDVVNHGPNTMDISNEMNQQPSDDGDSLIAFGTFKRDPADKDLLNGSTLHTSGQCESDNSEVVELVSSTNIPDLELPQTRAQSCYMETTLGIELQTEGNSSDGPSAQSPMLDIINHDLNNTVNNGMPNDMNLQSSDHEDVSGVHFESTPATEITFVVRIPSNADSVQTPFIKPEPLDDEVSLLRSAKRPRYFLEAVEVPTVASVLKGYETKGSNVRYDEQIGKYVNPKVKRKKDFVLFGDTIRERMRSIGGPENRYPVPLEKLVQDFPVTRQFLSSLYGGNLQKTFLEISEEKFAVHGLGDFVYPNLVLNPYAPETSGAPGLFFAPSDTPAGQWEQVQRVISRIDRSQWQYVGQYRMAPAASLTKDEWASQTPKVRNAWAREICERGWGIDTLARIYLRKTLGRAFMNAELNKEFDLKRKYNITPEEVSQAFLRGEESVVVWTMECIGYDVDFQLNLIEKFPTYVPPPSKRKQKPTTGAKTAEASKSNASARTGQKRKRAEMESSDEDGHSGDFEEDSDFEVEELVYKPRGTRSRPINIM